MSQRSGARLVEENKLIPAHEKENKLGSARVTRGKISDKGRDQITSPTLAAG